MAVCDGNITDVAGGEVEGARGLRSGEGGYASVACKEKIPFVGGQVPVDFAHGTWGNGEKGSGEVVCNGEDGWVGDFDRAAARDDQSRGLGHVVGVVFVTGEEASWTSHFSLGLC